MSVRRMMANHLRARTNDWPIQESASGIPHAWPGWPDGKQFAFVLTHDVEGIRGLQRCQKLAELDKGLGFRSSFNFVPEGEYRLPLDLHQFLSHEGFEVGIHDLHHDGSLYRSLKSFKEQAQVINEYVKSWGAVGFRSGFMFHNLEWLKDLNILYDASTFDVDPFEPQPDGVGTIFPFWVQGDGSHGYVELPYTLPQDSTLFLLLREKTIDLWMTKLDWIAANGGMALVNVHPDYVNFQGEARPSEFSAELYESFLKYVNSRYKDTCWFALPRDVAQYVASFRPVRPTL
jgi:hypothetical protein